METYAAKIEDGTVTQVIVGNANWATERLGGFWANTDTLVGNGWLWDEVNGFQPPVFVEDIVEQEEPTP
jgi:hypothetical protein